MSWVPASKWAKSKYNFDILQVSGTYIANNTENCDYIFLNLLKTKLLNFEYRVHIARLAQ